MLPSGTISPLADSADAVPVPRPKPAKPTAAITTVTTRVEIIIPPAYVTIPWFWAAITAEAAAEWPFR